MANVGHTGEPSSCIIFIPIPFLYYKIFIFIRILGDVLGLLCYVWRKVNQRDLLGTGE